MKSRKVSYVFTDAKFVKIPLSCVAGFIQGLTFSSSCDFNVVKSVNIYGDMATIEWFACIEVEE